MDMHYSCNDIYIQLNKFFMMSAPADWIQNSFAGTSGEEYKKQKNALVEIIGDVFSQFSAVIRDQEQQLREAMEKLADYENEVARLNSILSNNSSNSGVTSTVARSNATTRRIDNDEKDSKTEQIAQAADQATEASGKAPNEFNDRAAKAESDRKKGVPQKKIGGQPGHEGKTLTQEEARAIIESNREQYGIEPEIVDFGDPSKPYSEKYLIGTKRLPVVKIYRFHQDDMGRYNVPKTMKSGVVYDPSVIREMVYLRTVGNMSVNKIASYFNDSSNGLLKPSEGTICNALESFAEYSQPSLEWIKDGLEDNAVLYTDATYTFVNGESAYIRNISSVEAALYIPMDSKSLEALSGIPILPGYEGILIHDHEVVIYHFGKQHGECIVHLIRYGRKNIEETGNQWAQDLIDFFVKLNHEKQELLKLGIHSFSSERMDEITREYEAIIQRGREQNKTTRLNYARKHEATLLNRLEKYQDSHLLFLNNFDVDWCNNRSEQDLRKAKRHTAVSGGFRSPDALEFYCDALSVIETMKKQNLDVWNSILQIIENKVNVFGESSSKESRKEEVA